MWAFLLSLSGLIERAGMIERVLLFSFLACYQLGFPHLYRPTPAALLPGVKI